jgi:hypothetical protein
MAAGRKSKSGSGRRSARKPAKGAGIDAAERRRLKRLATRRPVQPLSARLAAAIDVPAKPASQRALERIERPDRPLSARTTETLRSRLPAAPRAS